jgi:predicted Fe-Mo cluster-binding NifX family protein
MNSTSISIAVVTDDGQTISRHFGRARQYEVFRIEGGAIVGRERRDKPGHHAMHGHDGGQHGHTHGHGHDHHSDEQARRTHDGMLAPIRDCHAVITGGMGMGAWHHLERAGITPVITTHQMIDEAVHDFIHGTLENHPDRLH